MTVIRPNSVTGINSITVQSGNSLAVHKANGELIRTLTSSSGVSTFSTLSVGTATTDNSAAKSINIGLGASISQHEDNSLSFGTVGDERLRILSGGQVNIGSNLTQTTYVCEVAGAYNKDGVRIVSGAPNYQDPFVVASSTGGERFRIKGDGKVTVGSAVTDASLLNVKGSAGFADDGTNAGIIISTDDANGAGIHCLTTGGFSNGSYGIMRLNALQHKFTYGNTVRAIIKSDGKIGIGTDATTSTLQIYGANDGEGTATGQLTLKDTAAYNASPTAGIIFQGHHSSNNAQAIFGGIRGIKGNDTDGNYSGILAFDVRKHGAVAYEAMRLNEDGRLLINTTAVTNTNDQLTVQRQASAFTEMSLTVDANTTTGTHANALIFTKSKSTYWNGYAFQSSHGYIGALLGKRDSAGTTDQEIRMEIGGDAPNQNEEKTWTFRNSGNLALSAGNLEFASGYGIDFSANSHATGMTSELLDHYEEGTFSLTVASGGFSSVTGTGSYTRSGRTVIFQGDFSLAGTGNGDILKLDGLPYAANSWVACSGYAQYYSNEGSQQASWAVRGNTNDISVVEYGNEATGNTFSAGYMNIAGCYQV